MGLMSKRKGKKGELEAVALLRPLFPEARRSAQQGRGGHEQPDILGVPGWWCEVGVGGVNPRRKWEQAHADVAMAHLETSFLPLALTRSDRGAWLVTLRAEDWMELVRK